MKKTMKTYTTPIAVPVRIDAAELLTITYSGEGLLNEIDCAAYFE